MISSAANGSSAHHSYVRTDGRRGDQSMSKFKIKLARIEAASGRADTQVCITFQIERGTVNFPVPIRLNGSDYDDTEMVKAARSILHQTFLDLAAQTRHWSLSAKELRLLSGMNLRTKK
jgi:hypothetical protein